MWRDEWRRHANGTTGVIAAIHCATDPAKAALLYERMFGTDALTTIAGGLRLTMALSALDVINPETLTSLYGDAAADAAGRDSFLAALVLRSPDLHRAAAHLHASGIRHTNTAHRIIVPASETMGVTIEFRRC